MLRKQTVEKSEKVDRWLVSYADFITLLFAFFVVMYSISQVNEGKYKVLSESLLSAFDATPKSLLPIQEGEISRVQPNSEKSDDSQNGFNEDVINENIINEDNFASQQAFQQIEQQLQQQLAPLIDNDLISISSSESWLEINLRSALLFESGSDTLASNARVVIETISDTLRQNNQLISVRGHTDNVPINTSRFSSNWSLSASRSVAVVRLLQSFNIKSQRLKVEAHGEYQPIASNATAEGRAKNRRVTIAVSRYLYQESETTTSEQVREQSPEQTAGQSPVQETPGQSSEADAEPTYEIVRLPGGGLLIRGKQLPDETKNNDKNDDEQNNQ